MGGELRDCGCYDGPFSADNPVLVSARCEEHLADGPRPGNVLLRRDAEGRLFRTRPTVQQRRRSVEKMAIPKGRRRR